MNSKVFLKVLPFAGSLALLATPMALAQSDEDGKRPNHFLEKFDSDKDGKVQREEFDAVRAAMFEEIDTNNNGTLSMKEIRAHREKMREEREKKRFENMDKDGSGELSAEEFGSRRAGMFDRLDENDDGVLEQSEFPKHGRRMGHMGEHYGGPHED